jgi:hypothetical protein
MQETAQKSLDLGRLKHTSKDALVKLLSLILHYAS